MPGCRRRAWCCSCSWCWCWCWRWAGSGTMREGGVVALGRVSLPHPLHIPRHAYRIWLRPLLLRLMLGLGMLGLVSPRVVEPVVLPCIEAVEATVKVAIAIARVLSLRRGSVPVSVAFPIPLPALAPVASLVSSLAALAAIPRTRARARARVRVRASAARVHAQLRDGARELVRARRRPPRSGARRTPPRALAAASATSRALRARAVRAGRPSMSSLVVSSLPAIAAAIARPCLVSPPRRPSIPLPLSLPHRRRSEPRRGRGRRRRRGARPGRHWRHSPRSRPLLLPEDPLACKTVLLLALREGLGRGRAAAPCAGGAGAGVGRAFEDLEFRRRRRAGRGREEHDGRCGAVPAVSGSPRRGGVSWEGGVGR